MTAVIVTALTGSIQFGMAVGGAVAGAILGGVSGGWEGALKGAAIGFVIGATMGSGIATFGPGFAAAAAIAGATYAGVTGGAEGLGDFAAGMAGSMVGSFVGNAIVSNHPSPGTTKNTATSSSQAKSRAETKVENNISNGQLTNANDSSSRLNPVPAAGRAEGAAKIAEAAQTGRVGRGGSVLPKAESKVSIAQNIVKALKITYAKTELFLNKLVHAPIHMLAAISEAYGPMDSPVSLYLNDRFPAQPLVNFLAEQALEPLDTLFENSIAGWEQRIYYLENTP